MGQSLKGYLGGGEWLGSVGGRQAGRLGGEALLAS